MASNIKQLREEVKAHWFGLFKEFIEKGGEYDFLQTASNEFAIPVLDKEGGEHYIVVTVKIPTGSRDGDAYDGYAVAEDYALKCKAKAEKVAQKERKAQEHKSKGSK